jgi:hypothetical protein
MIKIVLIVYVTKDSDCNKFKKDGFMIHPPETHKKNVGTIFFALISFNISKNLFLSGGVGGIQNMRHVGGIGGIEGIFVLGKIGGTG